jgi:agarase
MRPQVFTLLLVLSVAAAAASRPQVSPYIRVVQKNGVWWFQDGHGHTFFSLGVNCLGGCFGHTETAPIAPARKAWILSVLRAWGVNTAAAWSSPSLWHDLYVADRIYAPFASHADDVFDESFWSDRMVGQLTQEVQPFLGQQWFIGYFLDNEPVWSAREIFAFYLSLAKHRSGSQAFVTYCRAYYQERIDQLNTDWGTEYASFDQLPESRPPTTYTLSMRHGILQAWRIEVASTYYRRYAALVRALDPDHLILGIRYQGMPDLPLFTALSPYFDVNSINYYTRYGDLPPQFADLYYATGKPILLTEFSFSGFPTPGQPSALFVEVYSQENRGIGYHKYVQQAAQAPFMVGMHWFMWSDYGKEDNSLGGHPADQNVGLVSADETVVYEALGGWIARTNAAVAALHQNGRGVPPPRPTPQHRALERLAPMVDGVISEWPIALSLKPIVRQALATDMQVDHTYFIAWNEQSVCLAGDIADSHLDAPPQDREQEADYWGIWLRPVTPGGANAGETTSFFLSPIGGGPDGQQPYATSGDDRPDHRQHPFPVAKRLKPGGYTIEACIPAAAVAGFKGSPGEAWHVELMYQNVNEIYLTHWGGVATLTQ